jgi:hypothetical protein
MEEIIDFEEFLRNIKLPEVSYVAVFDPETGEVKSVGPSHAFENKPYKIPLDKETAELIIEGKIRINSCFVDITGNTLEIAEIKSVFKIDDVLHRVVETKWAEFDKADIYITYDKSQNTLTVELTEEFHGTKKLADKFQPVNKRKVIWSGDTTMKLLITDYNDPNVLYTMITLTVADLVEQKKVFENIELPERFSIYTRRIFKNYVLGDL